MSGKMSNLIAEMSETVTVNGKEFTYKFLSLIYDLTSEFKVDSRISIVPKPTEREQEKIAEKIQLKYRQYELEVQKKILDIQMGLNQFGDDKNGRIEIKS